MESVTVERTVSLPDRDDFADRFRRFGGDAEGDKSDLFDLVMRPETFLAGAVITDVLGLPAVTAIAEQAKAARPQGLSDTDKQFLGAAVCSLMEANGYRKQGEVRRSIPTAGWNKGQVYEPVQH